MARHAGLEQFVASKETRQLFALDRNTGEIVFMPELAADSFREGCSGGRFVCPIDGCDSPTYEAVGGSSGRRHHFRHRSGSAAAHAPETWLHELGKKVLGQEIQQRYPQASVHVDTKAVDGGRRPDVLVELGGHRIAFEVQYSAITIGEWIARHENYASAGVHDVWLFGNRRPHLRPVTNVPAVPLVHFVELFLEIRLRGLPVRFIGPDARAIGTCMFESTYELYQALSRAELHLDPLAECTIQDGRFVVPADEMEGQARLERLERERVEALRAARHAALMQERRDREMEEAARRAAERQAEAVRREHDRDKIAAFKQRKQVEAAEKWTLAEVRFLELTGLAETPPLVSEEIRGDRGIWMHPAHWHARLYYERIHDKTGTSFTFTQAGRMFYKAQGDNAMRGVSIAVRAYLLELRRHGLVWFESDGWYIEGDIVVLGDLVRPPDQELARRSAFGGLRLREANGKRVLVAAASGEVVLEVGRRQHQEPPRRRTATPSAVVSARG